MAEVILDISATDSTQDAIDSAEQRLAELRDEAERVMAAIAEASESAYSDVSSAAEDAAATSVDAADSAAESASESLSGIADSAQDSYGGVADAAQSARDEMADSLDSAREEADSTFGQMRQSGSAAFAAIAAAALAAIGEIISALNEAANEISAFEANVRRGVGTLSPYTQEFASELSQRTALGDDAISGIAGVLEAQLGGLTGDLEQDLVAGRRLADFATVTGYEDFAAIGSVAQQYGLGAGGTLDLVEQLGRTSQGRNLPGGPGAVIQALRNFGPTFQSLGLGASQSAEFAADFIAQGIPYSRVNPGIRQAVAQASGAGEDPAEAIGRAFRRIRYAETPEEALDYGIEVFGSQADRIVQGVRGGASLDYSNLRTDYLDDVPSLRDLATPSRGEFTDIVRRNLRRGSWFDQLIESGVGTTQLPLVGGAADAAIDAIIGTQAPSVPAQTNINVTVQGSVITEDDLTQIIQRAFDPESLARRQASIVSPR